MKYKSILLLLLFPIAAMADMALIVKPLQGSEQAKALAEIGYVKMTNDSLFVYSHADYLLSKTAIQDIRHIRYGETTNTPTSIESTPTTSISVYPNPTQETLIVSNTGDEILYIFDLRGHLLQTHQAQTGSTTISVSALPQGTYLLLIGAQSSSTQMYKFIKQ